MEVEPTSSKINFSLTQKISESQENNIRNPKKLSQIFKSTIYLYIIISSNLLQLSLVCKLTFDNLLFYVYVES